MAELTLLRRQSPLAEPAAQVRVLERRGRWPAFGDTLAAHALGPLVAGDVEVLQVNLGKLCNQTCRHCHVDAGPDRRESMSRETAAACLRALQLGGMTTLDLTGGAPEMNPHFPYLVAEGRALGARVIDRCNLTILTAPGFEHLPQFLAEHGVEVVASLPCYLEENCDRQRGEGVFERSIEALRRLNRLGYGSPDSGLRLTLAYNPLGPSLPPPQAALEAAYRQQLAERYGIAFTELFAIANLPISRFLDDLLASGKYEAYMQTLVDAFNPLAAAAVMCRTTISVDWQGNLYDCDFNQMLALPLRPEAPRTIFEFSEAALAGRPIAVGNHCYGCTAGAGSSCQGRLVAPTS
jgi:radical SAM/Cys-rich protein